MAGPRKRTIATNPFDQQLGASQPAASAAAADGCAQPWRDRITIPLPFELQERVRNAVYWMPGLTLRELAHRAFIHVLEEVEEANGGPFPPRRGELPMGRPIR